MMSAALPPSRDHARDHALPPRGGESPARKAQQAAGGVSRLAAMQVCPTKRQKQRQTQTQTKRQKH